MYNRQQGAVYPLLCIAQIFKKKILFCRNYEAGSFSLLSQPLLNYMTIYLIIGQIIFSNSFDHILININVMFMAY